MDRFHFDSIVGEGSFGTVYRCKHLHTGKLVAVKRFRQKVQAWKAAYHQAEIQALIAVRGHENIIQMHEISREADGTVMFSMDLFDGSLYDLLNHQKALNETDARSLLRQLVTGLHALHSVGYVHRDIKPENILISAGSDGRPMHVAVADLGSAARFPLPPLTKGSYVTSRFYRSPEMVFRDPDYGPKIDIWAVGCVAFEAIAGHPLFPAKGEADLLLRVCSVLGSPPMKDERCRKMVHVKVDNIPTMFPKQSIRRWFMGSNNENPSSDLLSLLEKSVCWIPEQRFDCATALRTELFLRHLMPH